MIEKPPATGAIRLAELLAVMSLGADLGLGQPMEHVVRQTVIALRLAEDLGLDEDERRTVYYVSHLAWIGCHLDAYEQAKWFGDDLAVKGYARELDLAGLNVARLVLAQVGSGQPPLRRALTGMSFLGEGRRAMEQMLMNHWFAADDLANRLALDQDVRNSLYQTFERWDGRGQPGEAKGDAICLPARLVALADVVEVFHRAGGIDAATRVASQRAGRQLDPELVDRFCRRAPDLLADLEAAWDDNLAAEPRPVVMIAGDAVDGALEAVADFVDVKSPFTLGHSRRVASLAETAAIARKMPDGVVQLVRRAALVHDLGRLGVSNSVWDKPTELTAAERERVRMHPYLTERMLSFSTALAPLATTAVRHHERLDGSGYPLGLRGAALTSADRLLAAADAYATKCEPRPHRPAMTPNEAAAHIRGDVRAGRLDGDSVEAVLAAAGQRPRRRTKGPDGLTAREIDVLRLLALGLSNKQIADRLRISKKTAGSHIEHVYAKIGVSNRARASLYAVKHNLMEDQANA